MKYEYQGTELELFKNATNWKKYFSAKLHQHIRGNVLEVGAGVGTNFNYLFTENSKHWTFVEPDLELFQVLKSKCAGEKIPTSFINGTIENIQAKFDTIIYIDCLEHIEKSKQEIEHCYELLNDNGKLIILVPAYNYLFNEFDKQVGHYRRYNKTMLRSEINDLLVEQSVFYLDSLGFFASLANKLIIKKKLPTEKDILFWDKFLIPISKLSDLISGKSFGKSLIGVYKKEKNN